METCSTASTVETTTPATVETSTSAAVKASTPTPAVGAATSTTVTTVLGQRHIWCESQSGESSKRDNGFSQNGFAHKLGLPFYYGGAHSIKPRNYENPPLERMHTECQWSW
jgi:hypothetical protein